ncbi:hypothetical protein C8F04DRAFT_1240310 [Mycena alexandri]|uniref:Uncharacterized protein n=1 Tax=Mycena alexandri TaxID=1745969 RepID=A0AAD6WQ77_9AGAR|nr:hypothetical protein C8F04DRAFT_1240310 [Mycena alexandri]
MGGTLWACGPGQTTSDVFELDDSVSMYYRYSGFTEFKGIVLNATIAFLATLSGKQISKKLLIDEGIATPESLQDAEEAVVIVNYRSRIDAAISLLRSWLKSNSAPRPADPILSMFGGGGSSSNFHSHGPLAQFLAQRAFLADFIAELPIDFAVINPRDLEPEQVVVPHILTELRLAGIHAFILFPDNDGTLPYDKVKEVERLLRTVRSYCEFDSNKWGGPPPPPEYQPPRIRVPAPVTDAETDPSAADDKDGGENETTQDQEDGDGDIEEGDDEDEQHFIDQMITVFATVLPGGTART